MTRSIFSLLLLGSLSACAAPWPQWRGPDGQGHTGDDSLPVKWSDTENVVWKTELPGRAWSSPVVSNDLIWLTTALETKASEAEKERRRKETTNSQPLSVLEKVNLRALAVDRATGKLMHDIELLIVQDPQAVHELNSYASPSPILDNGRLYAHFGALGTACVDTASGKVLWTNTELKIKHENGPGSSPVLWKDLLIFHMDGSDAQFIAALDAATGKLVWKTPRSGTMHEEPQMKKSYGTPLIVSVNGAEQLFSPASDWLYAYNQAGSELWKLPYGELGFSLTPRPVAGNGIFYMSTGFMKPELLAIRYQGVAQPEVLWRHTKNVPSMPSPILLGEELYFVNDSGMLTCLNAKTGEELYRERLDGEFSASPTATATRLYFSDRKGNTTVVKAGPKFEVLAVNKLPSPIFASLAAVDHAFYLRTEASLYKIAGGAVAAK